ncbi:MAG: M24 family metallopeptidase [Desulfarculus sp.]|jgi:Xaa-Pro aminopeptidase|nr:MAG: M24 family metallopeptidase [Desulfarculus sp.]
MSITAEIRQKEARVRRLLEEKGLEALLLKRQANFSWLTGGGLNLVGITTEVGATALLITNQAKFLVSNNIEAPRMVQEERLLQQGFQVLEYPWYEEREAAIVQERVGAGRLGADVAFPGALVLAEDIARLRYCLTPAEVERYQWLGERVSRVLEETVLATRPGDKESEVVGRLAQGLWADRIDAVTLMAAADERVAAFRHPIPTEKPVERYLMVSVNARKWGLIVSLTRFLHFGPLPAELRRRYLANVRIDCAFMAATRPGVPAREVLKKGVEAYVEQGYAEEWKRHHQGGAIGYTGRDYRANFRTPDLVAENQAFTWNPSLSGTKSEDTILATNSGPQMITRPIIYPTLTLETAGLSFTRPDVLEKY